MHLSIRSLVQTALLGLLHLPTAALAATQAATYAHAESSPSSSSLSTTTTKITLRLPNTHPLLPSPHLLPPSTRATLTTAGRALAAPLSAANTFVFSAVPPGTYLVDVHCVTHAFAPLRLDVVVPAPSGEETEGEDGTKVQVRAWETFRGNDWGNKGAGVQVAGGSDGDGVVVEVRVAGRKGYFMERSSFSVLSVFKNPIILLSLVSMALFFGMPKLVENMDPEMRAEWEEHQKENPMNAIMGAASGQRANPMGNFDMAAFLAGSTPKTDEGQGKAKGEGKKRR